MNYNIKNAYNGLSKDEMFIISKAMYEDKKVLTRNFLSEIYSNKRKIDNTLYNLNKKGRLCKIEPGKYFIVPITAPQQYWSPNEFLAAKYWMGKIPYYIGYQTMYNYWGFTKQVAQRIYILNTEKSQKDKQIGNIYLEAIKISQKKYYGTKEIEIEGEKVLVSDRERTLLDFIEKPSVNFETIEKIIKQNMNDIDFDKFLQYLAKYQTKAVVKRAGYFMQNIGIKDEKLEKIKQKFKDSKSYVVLNPRLKERKGRINKDWKVILNGNK